MDRSSASRAERFLAWLLPHKDVQREEGKLYLRRHYLTPRTWRFDRWFLHLIARTDPDEHRHDHPWAFSTRVLRGGYVEEYEGADGRVQYRFVHPLMGRVKRPAGFTHRIVSVLPGTWTLVRAEQAEREWGFWVDGAHVPWWRYLGLPNEPAPEDARY